MLINILRKRIRSLSNRCADIISESELIGNINNIFFYDLPFCVNSDATSCIESIIIIRMSLRRCRVIKDSAPYRGIIMGTGIDKNVFRAEPDLGGGINI
jgi:hypothetical protein